MSHNTHRKTLARALAAATGLTYTQALDVVRRAAAAGQLPDRLDPAGITAAVSQLAAHTATGPARHSRLWLPATFDDLAAPLETALAARPHGLILSIGGTGTGKSTSARRLARLTASPDSRLNTVESPVEEHLPEAAYQLDVTLHPHCDFARAIHLTLRTDPDVMLLDELLDAESVQRAFDAALTGHLVIATMHALNPQRLMRLLPKKGVDDFIVDCALGAVISHQRVSTVCRSCRDTTTLTPADGRRLLGNLWTVTETVDVSVAPPWGCPACRHTGFAGTARVRSWHERDTAGGAELRTTIGPETDLAHLLLAGEVSPAIVSSTLAVSS